MALSIQKANFWKRISAYMFDVVILVVLTLALSLATHAIFKVDSHIDKLNAYRAEYAQEAGINLDLTKEEYNAMSKEEQKAYDDAYNEMNKAMAKDKDVLQANRQSITSVLLSFTVSLFLSTLLVHFIVPLCFKHGRTLGKKIFGLAVIRTNGVKITSPVFFIRSMVGLFAIETMFPLFILIFLGMIGRIVFVAFFLLQIFVLFRSPFNASIHDLLTDSVVVDMASQTIYETNDELLAAQKAEALEQANAPENVVAPALYGMKTNNLLIKL